MKPILFNDEMVRAILDGRKTQTRRVMKPQPRVARFGETHPTRPNGVIGHVDGALGGGDYHVWQGPRFQAGLTHGGVYLALNQCQYQPGDRLWVREAFRPYPPQSGNAWEILYAADAEIIKYEAPSTYRPTLYNYERWYPSIHMPRWASRITLEITDVRVQRLRDISEDDALAEGIQWDARMLPFSFYFMELWDSIAKPGVQWSDNPWVWAISFQMVEVCNA